MFGNLISSLIVNGAANAAGKVAGNVAGNAIGKAVGGAAGQAIGGGYQAPTAPTQAVPQTPEPTTVDEVTVEGQAPTPDDFASSALVQALAGYGGGDVGASDYSSPAAAAPELLNVGAGGPMANTVSGVDVIGGGLDTSNPLAPAALGAAVGAAGGSGLEPGQQDPAAAEEEGQTDEDQTEEEKKKSLLEKYGPLGLLGLLGLKPADLLGLGLLGASLGKTGGSDPNAPGTPGGALTDIAKSNQALAGRLGNIADAGMQGNIGAKGTSAIARMVRNAQAAIRSRYAAMGMSGSTAEAQDLNGAAEAGVDMQFKVGQQMAQTGLNAIASLTGQSATVYAQLLNAQTQRDTALGNSLANFAGALVK